MKKLFKSNRHIGYMQTTSCIWIKRRESISKSQEYIYYEFNEKIPKILFHALKSL